MFNDINLGEGVTVKWFATSVAAIAAVAVAAFFAAGWAHSQQAANWDTETATIVDTPKVSTADRGEVTVTATVRTDRGDELNMAVESQAATGDTVQVLRNRDTGKLYRALAVGDDPFLSPGLIAWGAFGVAVIAWCVVTLVSDFRGWQRTVNMQSRDSFV